MAQSAPQVPQFISYLFSTKPKFDCYFEVGNKSLVEPERIGAVKMMLMAHSEVFRLLLEDSALAEKGEVPVVDINPDIFKIMLKFVYGYDTTSDLCFEEADDLFYVADKYMILSLKNKLARRLMSLLTPGNVCSLLNNPACFNQLELSCAITQILRYETDEVLASPQMLELSAAGFLKILEQDGMVVPEVELWMAAVKWAKNKADSECGRMIRQQVSQISKHIRICTLNIDQVGREVVPTTLLTNGEMGMVCRAIFQQEQQEGLSEFSADLQPRKLLQKKQKSTSEGREQCSITFNDHKYMYCTKEATWTVLTKHSGIELLPLECKGKHRSRMVPEGATYPVDCDIKITRITDYVNNISSEDPVTISFREKVEFGKTFMIPLSSGGGNVILLPHNKYIINMRFADVQDMYYCRENVIFYDSDHLSLEIEGYYSVGYQCFFNDSPTNSLLYRLLLVD